METLEVTLEAKVTERTLVFKEWYQKAFPLALRFVVHRGGSLEDAQDIFQDALVIYYEKTQDANFALPVSEEAYLLGICKHLWIRKFAQESKSIVLDVWENGISIPDDYFPSIDQVRLVNLLERAGKKCMDLLQAFYFEKVPVKTWAEQFGFGSIRSATVQKYKCLEKVREFVKQKSLAYEDFVE